MTPHVVADIGNTRIKWGRCSPDAVIEMVSLPPDEPAAWQEQSERWQIAPGSRWVIAGVHPARRDALSDWLERHGQQVRVVTSSRDLLLQTLLPEPDKAGIDRLLNAVAALHRRRPNHGAILVDAGSAVTIDWLLLDGTFAGGAIMPGFRLMAKALHEYTALLPSIEPPREVPAIPGLATIPAMEVGLFWSIAGAIDMMVRCYEKQYKQPVELFLTGGDATLLPWVYRKAILWPEMTLEGLRWTAETLT